MKVPPVARALLRSLLAADERDDLDDAELVFEEGAGWWLDTGRIPAPAASWLVMHVLVGRTSEPSAKLERWQLNEHGREAAKTGVVPQVVIDALAKMDAQPWR